MTYPPRPPYIPLPYRFALDSSLSNTEFRVLVLLMGYFSQEDEVAQVTLPELAEKTGMHKSTVSKTLTIMEAKGYIKTRRTNYGNVYTICEDEEQAQEEPTCSSQNTNMEFAKSEDHVGERRTSCSQKIVYLPLESNTIITHSDKHAVNNTVCDTTNEEFEEYWKAYPKPRNPDKTPRFKQHDTLRARSIAAVPLPFEFKKRRRLRGANPRTPRFKPQCAVIFGFAPCGAEERSMNNGI